MSKFGGVWRSGSDSDKADDPLYGNILEQTTEQKTLASVHTHTDSINSPISSYQTREDQLSAYHKNGGKSCHPKMRAKFMFRTGDIETCDWGYDWSSSDNESLNKGCTEGRAPVISETSAPDTEPISNPLKRKRSDSISELSSITSETTIPAVDDIGSPLSAKQTDFWAPCPILNNNTNERNPFTTYTDTMPVLAKALESENETTDPEISVDVEHSDSDVTRVTSGTICDDVFVTEITCDDVTVIFQESQRSKGFFKWQD